MSITYDPDKWTNPLRANDHDEYPRKSKAPVIVSIDETRYFKVRSKPVDDLKFKRILATGNLVEQPRTNAAEIESEED